MQKKIPKWSVVLGIEHRHKTRAVGKRDVDWIENFETSDKGFSSICETANKLICIRLS